MMEEITLALGTTHEIKNVGGTLPKCMKCDSNASPLFIGMETVSFDPPLIRPVLYCRGCITLNLDPVQSQEYKVG